MSGHALHIDELGTRLDHASISGVHSQTKYRKYIMPFSQTALFNHTCT